MASGCRVSHSFSSPSSSPARQRQSVLAELAASHNYTSCRELMHHSALSSTAVAKKQQNMGECDSPCLLQRCHLKQVGAG